MKHICTCLSWGGSELTKKTSECKWCYWQRLFSRLLLKSFSLDVHTLLCNQTVKFLFFLVFFWVFFIKTPPPPVKIGGFFVEKGGDRGWGRAKETLEKTLTPKLTRLAENPLSKKLLLTPKCDPVLAPRDSRRRTNVRHWGPGSWFAAFASQSSLDPSCWQ